MNNWRFSLLGLGLFSALLATHGPSMAQSRAGGCLVAEFRSLALLTHDVSDRISKVNAWLKEKGPRCTTAQLAAIASNRATWLGTADTIDVAGQVDGLIEAKIANDPEMIAAMYTPKGKESRASVEVTRPPPAPAPVVPPPAPVQVAGGVNVAQPAMVLPAERPRDPELPNEFFTRRQKQEILKYYEENRGSGECPKGMLVRGEKCDSLTKIRPWKPEQPLPVTVRTEELPLPLFYKLGPPPAEHQYKKVGFDILMVKGPQMLVTDAVLDLGGIVPVKAPQDDSDKKNAKSKD